MEFIYDSDRNGNDFFIMDADISVRSLFGQGGMTLGWIPPRRIPWKEQLDWCHY